MLLGNPADFDRIRARYEALKYPTPAEASFNAARTSYEGLLTGSGYDTAMIPTTAPGEQVSFSVDPNTGQVTTNIPQYEVPTFETIYDAGEGLIGADGLPADVASTSMGGGITYKADNGFAISPNTDKSRIVCSISKALQKVAAFKHSIFCF